MTAERYLAPLFQGAPASGYSSAKGAPEPDLFAFGGNVATPHPDFLARAAIWRDQAAGLISIAEARRRSAGVGLPAAVEHAPSTPVPTRARAKVRPRHTRPSPNESRQYAQAMATTAARDDRLTPQAKAFLQVLRARCGKGRETTITKGTAASIMSRSARTIRRYLVDLVRFGYIELATRSDPRGMHLGLKVKLTELVTPFYEEARGLARWLAETPKAAFQPFAAVLAPLQQGVTLLTPKNQTQIISFSPSVGNAVTDHKVVRGRLSRKMGARVVPEA